MARLILVPFATLDVLEEADIDFFISFEQEEWDLKCEKVWIEIDEWNYDKVLVFTKGENHDT